MTARPHPDRDAATLAQRNRLLADPSTAAGPFQMPGDGSCDARVDLHLLRHAAAVAMRTRGTDAARQRLDGLDTPDLLAGTVQDGTARGLHVALEEAMSLCAPAAPELADVDPEDDARTEEWTGKALRRKRDILVASGGARIRFSRRDGVLLVDRDAGIHAEDCLLFEDRTDAGTLDGFEPVAGERARLFSPAFLSPAVLRHGPRVQELHLVGQLGRGHRGYPCRLVLVGRHDERCVRMTLRVDNRHTDHRLRIRFRGVPDGYVHHCGTPAWSRVEHRGRTFVTATLVRACGRLQVGSRSVAVPDAQLQLPIEHRFGLGACIPGGCCAR
ncbi:MAG: hypothetical protein KDC87_02580 [Planctomycetes bacterium]|nr:hypothetical protein [Planctomycetota bacterium]